MMSKRRRIWSIIGVLAAILVFWIAATLFLSPAYAGAVPFSMEVRSRLLADYNPDTGKSFFTALRLSILGDSLRDQGLSDGEAQQRKQALEASLDDPVPTATALDFDGSEPYTATPTRTATPTDTPTVTPTNTPRPTNTPTRTKTPKPTNTAAPVDSVNPVIADPGSPAINTVSPCEVQVYLTSARVTDAAPSSGIKWVKFKYKVWDAATESILFAGYIMSNPLTKCSGGPTGGGGWDACYSGPDPNPPAFTIKIYNGFSSQPDFTDPAGFVIKLWLLTEDNVGRQASYQYSDLNMPATCDD